MKLNTGVHSFTSAVIFIGLVFGIQACGGGGGESSPTPTPEPLADQDGSGIYAGTATVDVSTNIADLRGMVYNNRFMFFSVTAAAAGTSVLYDGTITSISSDSYTATVDVYEDGALTAERTGVAVTGKVLTATSITGTIGTAGSAGVHNGTFSLTFDNAYNRAGTEARIAGIPKLNGTTYGRLVQIIDAYVIRENLRFGVSSFFCDIIDEVYAIPDSAVNIYTLNDLDIIDSDPGSDACLDAYEGSGFSRMMSLVDDGVGGTDNKVLIAYSNGSSSVFGIVTKP